jgi:hypothetical protein
MKMKIIFLAAAIMIAGCSKQLDATDTSNLKPVTGAFGYTLGDKVSGEIENPLTIRDMPPFQTATIDQISAGRICQITAMGTVEEFDLHDTKNRLISVLTEKYGSRGKMGIEKYATEMGDEGYYFGTTNRAAHLWIKDYQTNAFFCLEYYDVELKTTFFKEQEAKNKLDDDNKKAALSKGL